MAREYIRGPAVTFRGKKYDLPHGSSHGMVIQTIAELHEMDSDDVEMEVMRTEVQSGEETTGFFTTNDRFVGRIEGWRIAKTNGQLTDEAKQRGFGVLHSDQFEPPPQEKKRPSD